MILTRFSTGLRIVASFVVILFIMAGMTGMALWRQHGAESALDSLVLDTLARERLLAEQLALVRLNGVRALSIAHSDSVEVADMFLAQLGEGDRALAANEAQLARQHALAVPETARRKAAYLDVRRSVLKMKEIGRTQDVAVLANGALPAALTAYVASIEMALQDQSATARALAAGLAEQFRQSRRMLIGLGLTALAVAALLSWWLTCSIVRPLRLAVAQAARVAQGDLRQPAPSVRGDELGDLLRAQHTMAAGLAATVGTVRQGAAAIDRASVHIASGNLDLSQRTELQADALDRTATAMHALTAAVQENARHVRQAGALAASASAVADKGTQVVGDMVGTMALIAGFGSRIADITSVIDGIAFQTNILALNAAVEAARAGEQGRGFAVVATEVRSLAQRSASAARDIQALVNQSASEIANGSVLARAAGTTMDEIEHSVKKVSAIIGAIGTASSAQQHQIDRVGSAIDDMRTVTGQNAVLVGDAAAASASLRRRAAELSRLVDVFQLDAGQAGAASDGVGIHSLGPAVPVHGSAPPVAPRRRNGQTGSLITASMRYPSGSTTKAA